jgi:hypothetical protein
MVTAKRSLVQIFLAPALIAGVIAFGLVSALLGDGIWDQASWIALAAPLAVIGFYVTRRAAPRTRQERRAAGVGSAAGLSSIP